MTPAIFLALLAVPLTAIAVMTVATCRSISAASRDAQEVIHNRAETRRNYARATDRQTR